MHTCQELIQIAEPMHTAVAVKFLSILSSLSCKIATILFDFYTDPVGNKSLVYGRLCCMAISCSTCNIRLCYMAPKAPSSSGRSCKKIAKNKIGLDGCFLTPDSDSGVQVDLVLTPKARPKALNPDM